MTDFFCEYMARERRRDLDAVDRQLEQWGWFRRGVAAPGPAAWRVRVAAALVRLAGWVQGGSGRVEMVRSGGAAAEEDRAAKCCWPQSR